ncbi:MAG: 16S rRNA (cytosine(1402)-N(4))-methyltransferase RsmH [Deltaproteobacteria bacterium]
MMVEFSHEPVLLGEVLALLAPGPVRLMLDGTAGGGGHARAMAERGSSVVALDRDPAALRATAAALHGFPATLVLGSYRDARALLAAQGLSGVDGALLDLGVSSYQLDSPERGFSFRADGPLDMRMGPTGETAAELIARAEASVLEGWLRDYGEEPFARRIAKAIKAASRMERTFDLVQAVEGAVPRARWPRHIHVATKTFQAIRIAVNRELEALEVFLSELAELLLPLGRAAIISFHSLEDRLVKRRFADLAGACRCPPGLPVCACGAEATFRMLTRKAIVASAQETERNPRARSARLRAVEKLERRAA